MSLGNLSYLNDVVVAAPRPLLSTGSFIAPSLRRSGDQVDAHTQGRRPPRRLIFVFGGGGGSCLGFATRESWQGKNQAPGEGGWVQGDALKEEGRISTGRRVAGEGPADLEEQEN